MTFLDLFAGIGGFRRGLERSGHTCVGHVEIDPYANRSYMAMFGLEACPDGAGDAPDIPGAKGYHNRKKSSGNIFWLRRKEEDDGREREESGGMPHEWYARDIKQLTAGEIPKAEIWTFGFPCTDISVSGRMAGLHGTRSGLFFEVARLLKGTGPQNKPRYLLIENVKHLVSCNAGGDFTTVLAELWEAGYGCEWCVVNSRDFGVPQHRERVYLVGYLGGGGGRKVFPLSGTDHAPVKGDAGGRGERPYGLSCASFIDLSKHPKLTQDARGIMAKQNAGITNHKGETSGVFLCKGHPDCVRAVLTPNRMEKRQNGRRFKGEGEPGFTLTCQDQHGVLLGCLGGGLAIREAKKGGCTVATHGDSINLSYPNSKKKRGRMGKQCAHTLLTDANMGVLLCFRIRRLTPRECWRLQAFDDFLFDRAKAAGVSDAQLYKQAGNAVTVNVVYEIGKRLVEIEKDG